MSKENHYLSSLSEKRKTTLAVWIVGYARIGPWQKHDFGVITFDSVTVPAHRALLLLYILCLEVKTNTHFICFTTHVLLLIVRQGQRRAPDDDDNTASGWLWCFSFIIAVHDPSILTEDDARDDRGAVSLMSVVFTVLAKIIWMCRAVLVSRPEICWVMLWK